MARKRSNRASNQKDGVTTRTSAPPPRPVRSPGRPAAPSGPARRWPLVGASLVVALVAVVGAFALLSGGPLAGAGTVSADDGRAAIVQGVGGEWAEITVDDLDAMLDAKDFTLLNVKTPYIGEIEGTDLYIPYDQLVARADELPADKDAKLVVYCRTGNQSGIAAQILVDLGYTDIVNVDGGMVAWADSGRQVVEVDRS